MASTPRWSAITTPDGVASQPIGSPTSSGSSSTAPIENCQAEATVASSPRTISALGHHRVEGVAEPTGEGACQPGDAEVGVGRRREHQQRAAGDRQQGRRQPGAAGTIAERQLEQPGEQRPAPEGDDRAERDAEPLGAGEESGLIGGDADAADQQRHRVRSQLGQARQPASHHPQHDRTDRDAHRADRQRAGAESGPSSFAVPVVPNSTADASTAGTANEC